MQEPVLFVGYPRLGKISFHKYFESKVYVPFNQDTLKTRGKFVEAAQEALAAGKKCIVENTNRDGFTRKYHIHAQATPASFLLAGTFADAWYPGLLEDVPLCSYCARALDAY